MDLITCSNCFQGQKALTEKLKQTIEDAQRYANENRTTVVVYPVVGGFKFMEKEEADRNGGIALQVIHFAE